MAPEMEHDTVNFTSLAPLSLTIGVKLGWSWNTMQRDLMRFCGKEAGRSVEHLVLDELSEPMLDLCDDIEQNVPMAGRL